VSVARRRLAGAVAALACVVAATVAAAPAPIKLSAADTRTLAEMALQWAVDGGISDFKRVKDPANLIVSTANLPPKIALKLAGRTVSVLPPAKIQARADKDGDFLYFRFGSFSRDKEKARVALWLVWAVSQHSSAFYLSGGGATLNFERHDGTWQLLPVTDRWMS